MRAGSVGTGIGTGMGLCPPAPPAGAAPAPYLAWEVSQQLLDTRSLCQRRASVQPPPGLAVPGAAARLCYEPRGSPGRDLHLRMLGTWYSTVPCPHGMGSAGAMALGTCSVMAFLSDHTPGAGQAADTRCGTGHGDSVGWDHAVGPCHGTGRGKRRPCIPCIPSSSFLFGTLPACRCHSAPCTPALGSPDVRGQHHSPAPSPPTPRPPTPRPPTPRPPMMGTPGERQWRWAAGQRLFHSLPSPTCACSSSGSPTLPMP